MRSTTLIKLAVALVAIGVLGVLFVRSVSNVTAEPYSMARDRLGNWTIGLDPAPASSGVLLALWPQPTLVPPLFSQVFRRSNLSLSGPDPAAMPLILRSEYERALSGTLSPEALAALAHDSGLDAMPPVPLCLAARRVSQPGLTRDLFFLRFAHPAFEAFRKQVAQQLSTDGGSAGSFDPGGLSPVMIVAATDANFASWLPLRGEEADDCLAPIQVQ